MQITLYKNFSKKINSTKQPTGGTVVDVKLKNPTSRENPTFTLNITDLDYNYVRWGDHYYYINDIVVASNDNIEISCIQDVLATYKSAIGSTSAFVEYATTGFNADILDPRISNTGNVSRTAHTAALSMFVTGGRLILSTVGTSGVADRYFITQDNLNLLGQKISTAPDATAEDVAKKFGNLGNCILGLTWIPYSMGAGLDRTVYLGNFDTEVHAGKINALQTINETITVSIPWINSEVCRQNRERIALYLPCFGEVNLEASEFLGALNVTIDVTADSTGSITYAVHVPGGNIKYFNANAGASIPVTQYVQSPMGMLLGAWSKGMADEQAEIEATSKLFGQANDFMSRIAGRLSTMGSSASSVGGQGSISLGFSAISHNSIYITNTSYQYSEAQANMATKYGRPVFAVKTLSSLSGYIQCNGASVDIAGLSDDKNAVNAFLNSGFFYE